MPSRMAKAAITNPATGSSQAAPVNWNSTSPARVETLNHTPDPGLGSVGQDQRIPTQGDAHPAFRRGQERHHDPSEATSTAMPTGEVSGISPAIRSRTPAIVT